MPLNNAAPGNDSLAPYLDSPVNLIIHDRMLRDQLRIILAMLGFGNVTVHPASRNYLENVRQTSQLLMKKKGLFLINPPQAIFGPGGKVRVKKEIPDFFLSVKSLVEKTRRDVLKTMSQCVPIFPDIQLPQKREAMILKLAQHGVSGAFILTPQESLASLSPSYRKIRLEEQINERMKEVRDYLGEYLPHMDGAVDKVMEKQEEIELSKRKDEADKWMEEGVKAKESGDFDRAVHCFTKAIELYPADPMAYLESGRAYTRLKQYPKALLRFNQAERVAESIPEPNKEIGTVRVLQVKDRLSRGESPKSPAIRELLEDALKHFETALKKAMKLKPLSPDDDKDPAAEGVTRIAGDIMKLNLQAMLGKGHPAVQKLSGLVRKAFDAATPGQAEQAPPNQLIVLGLAALNDGDYLAAERLFFKAAKDETLFAEACNQITSLGMVLRKREGPLKAIALYRHLLELDPPNKSVVCYNLALAYSLEKKGLESSSCLVQAMYLDPTLAETEAFYKSYQLNFVISKVVNLFSQAAKGAANTEVPGGVRKMIRLQDKLEALILTKRDKESLLLLRQLAMQLPSFFKRTQVLASKVIMDNIQARAKSLSSAKDPRLKKLAGFLKSVIKHAQTQQVAPRLRSYHRFKTQALSVLARKGDQAQAAAYLAQALVSHPQMVKSVDLYASQVMSGLARTIFRRLGKVDMTKVEA